jgi:hypothetical protein
MTTFPSLRDCDEIWLYVLEQLLACGQQMYVDIDTAALSAYPITTYIYLLYSSDSTFSLRHIARATFYAVRRFYLPRFRRQG